MSIMKKYLTILFCFLFISIYAQTRDTIYFLINKKDTLITKLFDSSNKLHIGYKVIDEKRTIEKIRHSSVLGGDDIKYETFSSIPFSFERDKDTIVSQSYLNTLKIIKSRREFLDVEKQLDENWTTYIFIEAFGCNKYILREVEILFSE